jgi:ParB/RepB/Spo0J family partition protein
VLKAPIGTIQPSPFQPKGRPSLRATEAVATAVMSVGTAARLIEEDGARELARLDPEARALAELSADIQEHGVEAPLEVRRIEGGFELLSGHRRLAAANLAGLSHVPVIDRGVIADHAAAAIVYRRNLLRKDFTAWQEAVSFSAIQRNRREAGLSDSVRAVARALGSSHGRAGDLLSIARSFTPALLSTLGRRGRRAGRGGAGAADLPHAPGGGDAPVPGGAADGRARGDGAGHQRGVGAPATGGVRDRRASWWRVHADRAHRARAHDPGRGTGDAGVMEEAIARLRARVESTG